MIGVAIKLHLSMGGVPESRNMKEPSSAPAMQATARGPTAALKPNSDTALYASSVPLRMSSLAPAATSIAQQVLLQNRILMPTHSAD